MNKVQIIIIVFSGIIGVLAILMFGGYIGGGVSGGEGPVGSLTVWGLEPEADYKQLFEKYRTSTRTKITYVRVDAQGFTEKLTKAIARNEGPDIVIRDIEWIMANRDILSTIPRQVITLRDYQTTYVEAANSFIIGNDMWAFPLWIDPMVLYWNKDIFNTGAIASPPKNWTETKKISNTTKVTGDGGVIKKGGIALGRARNIPLFKDILALLLLQQGGNIEDEMRNFRIESSSNTEVGVKTLKFYTDFGKPGTLEYTWNANLVEPRELFNQGKLAMMLDYVSYMPALKAKSPHLNFDVAAPPQLEGAEFSIYTASVGGTAVPIGSKKAAAGWAFSRWLSDQKNAQSYLQTKTLAPARRDLMNNAELAKNDLFPLLRQLALNARRARDTHPLENSSIMHDMIEAVADNRLSPSEAIANAQTTANKDRR